MKRIFWCCPGNAVSLEAEVLQRIRLRPGPSSLQPPASSLSA